MLKKIFFVSLIILLISCGVLAYSVLNTQEKKEDIPSPLSPSFVQKIRDCGKIGLIDRASPEYNPSALVDGSLLECDN